jgi:hypothetical protein
MRFLRHLSISSLMESNKTPRFWHLLSPEDQDAYTSLQQVVSAPCQKNRRNRSLQTFHQILEAIKAYVTRNDPDDWKRALVCGISWVGPDRTIALNTRQFRILSGKCKSSINGSLQLVGYGIVTGGTDCSASIARLFPLLKDDFTELRQWTIRQMGKANFISPAPEVPAQPTFVPQSGFGFEVRPVFQAAVKSPSTPFDDPMSFMPNDWGEKACFSPKEFEFPSLD